MSVKYTPMGVENRIEIVRNSRKDLRSPVLPGKEPCSGCIDDRFPYDFVSEIPEDLKDVLITKEDDIGPQIPGASVGIIAVLVESADENDDLIFDTMYDMVHEAHTRAGFGMGVHMDNGHSHSSESHTHGGHNYLSDQDIFAMVRRAINDPDNTDNILPGCGYVGMLKNDSNPLGLKDRSLKFFKNVNLVAKMISKGSKLVELEGFHADKEKGEAYAVSNMKPGTTLDHHMLKEKGLKVYGHDPLAADEIIKHLENVLRENGKGQWADNLHTNGVRTEREHHRIAALALAGMEPEEIY